MKKSNYGKMKIMSFVLLFTFFITQGILGNFTKVKAEENISVEVLVESHNKILALDKANKDNAYGALKEVLDKNNIKIEAQDSQYGKYISSIADVKAGKFGGYDGWLYAVYRDGKYENIMTSIDGFTLKNGDKLIVYYGDMGTLLANKIQYSTKEANKELTISLNNYYEDWQTKKEIVQPIKGIQVKLDGKSVILDENKIYLKEGLDKGEHLLQLIDFREAKCPLVVNDTIKFKLEQAAAIPGNNKDEDSTGDANTSIDIDKEIASLSKYIAKSEKYDLWAEISMNKLGIKSNEKFINSRNQYIEDNAKEIAKNGTEDFTNIELEKLMMTLVNNGYNPSSFQGHDLAKDLYNRDLKEYLINDKVFALIAYDYCNIENKNNINRDKLVESLLSGKLSYKVEGKDMVGWAFYGDKVDPDMTAMVITALSKYYNNNSKVKETVDKAIKTLAYSENENGYIQSNYGISSETLSAVIVGLKSIGVDVEKGEFAKNKGNLLSALVSFKDDNEIYKHLVEDKNGNYMSSEQALRALIAIKESKGEKYNYYNNNIKTENLKEYTVKQSIEKDQDSTELPKTGGLVDTSVLISLGTLFVLVGLSLQLKNRRKTN
ncbi:DUF4430 domain-containing protein [Clostridium brassicae]|uniref:Gram-positive cocci surface proteins LPxTG domain-containing protein n=1 Tax=Clostridium brassicae TaxID=2999072 RepID=A0ABT4D5U6_9CLOT|nr:DUF4430 domain-containing protein [Clostridium brassicae]MCY6957665.1 hypothetical protein [Clostridium brassicae]